MTIKTETILITETTRAINKIPGQWAIRIVGYGMEQPGQILFHPDMIMIHPVQQQKAIKVSLEFLGWCEPIIVNQRTGYALNGKARAQQAEYVGQEFVPICFIDLPKEYETSAIISFNGIGRMAIFDKDKIPGLDNSRLDNVVVTAGIKNTKVQFFLDKLIALGALKIGALSRKRVAAKYVSIEHLEEIKLQCKKSKKQVWQLGGPDSTLRLYGSAEDVEAYLENNVGHYDPAPIRVG